MFDYAEAMLKETEEMLKEIDVFIEHLESQKEKFDALIRELEADI